MLDMFLSALDTVDNQSDRDFLVEAYQNYKFLIFGIINGIVHNHEDAEDIMQELFIRLLAKVPILRSMDSKRRIAYVSAAAKNLSFDHLAHKNVENKHTAEEQQDFVFENAEADVNIENQVLHNEKLRALVRIWPDLSVTDRYLLRAKYMLGESDAEISKQLAVAEPSIRMMMTRARKRALALMQKEHAEP